MLKKLFVAVAWTVFAAAWAGEVLLSDFATLEEAQKAGWIAQSTATLSVPSPGVLRAVGGDQKRYCGMRLAKVPAADLSGTIRCDVKMNFGKKIFFALSTQNGYFDLALPLKPDTVHSLAVPLDIAKWRYHGKGEKPDSFGTIRLFSIMAPDMQKSSEFIEVSRLKFPVADAAQAAAAALPAATVAIPPDAPVLESAGVRYAFSSANGSLLAVENRKSGKFAVTQVLNHYFAMRRSGDAEAWEYDDRVQSRNLSFGALEFVCTNHALPRMEIVKRYRIEGNRLRRTLCFRNTGSDTLYLVPRTRIAFAPDFFQGGFYLGSGYVGPLMEPPKVTAPQRETAFLQTTKGMVLYHDGAQGSFAHYRTHLGGKFVFPWWQSAIRSYQEEPNALYYHPDGWEMALGTIDAAPGKSFSVDDCFVFFDGNWHTFLNDIYPNDPVVKRHLAALEPGPAWLDDVKVQYSSSRNLSDAQRLALLLDDEGETILSLGNIAGAWGDYHFDTPKPGFSGGSATREEMREMFAKVRKMAPKFRLGIYNWISSAMIHSELFRQHPDFFLLKDRQGRDKNLFPGDYVFNHPTMINRPDAAKFMLSNFQALIDDFKVDFIYLDETKTISLIDWEKGDLMRDDHWADFWLAMHRLGRQRDVLMFVNGRGNPYFELNYIEARAQLAPSYWRKFCGMGMAVANFVNHRPGGRVALLYWNKGMDYINRVLANGFIPVINFLNYNQIHYVSASYELGKSTIFDLACTPDWKNDPKTELESYCIRRDQGGELIFSVINRAKTDTAQITLHTEKLPADLTVWCYRVRKFQYTNSKYGFGERERRSNYLTAGWREGLITRPELLYSGKNPGKLEITLKDFPKDEFAQIVIAPVAGGVYSVEGQPCNYFLAGTRKVSLAGADETLIVTSQAESAEVILPRPPGRYRVNGKSVAARPVRFGERLFAVLTVPKGKSEIRREGDAEYPSKPFRAKLEAKQLKIVGDPGYLTIHDDEGFLLYCGDAPKLPEYHNASKLVLNTLDGKHPVRLAIPTGSPSPAMLVQEEPLHPAKLEVKKLPAPKLLDGARILESVVYTSQWRDGSGFQSALEPLTASADPATLTLMAGTTRRVQDYWGHAAAGFLLDNVRKVELELSTTFPHQTGIGRGYTSRYRRNPAEFAGIMLDFETKAGNFVRKALSVGALNAQNPRPGAHGYGAKQPAQEIYDLGNFIAQDKVQHFTLDIAKLAPDGWTGKVYFSAATGYVAPDRRVTLKLRHANDAARAETLTPADFAAVAKDAARPRIIDCPKLTGAVACDRLLREAPLPERFLKVGLSGYAETPCRAGIATDGTMLYAAFSSTLQNSDLQVEFWCVGDNGAVWQVIAYSNGTHQLYRNLVPVVEKGVKVTVGDGRDFLFALPLALAGSPAKEWRVNLACCRGETKKLPRELASYAPLTKSFNEPDRFARLRFGAVPGSVAALGKTDAPKTAPWTKASEVSVANLGKGGYTTGNIRNSTLAKALKLKPAVTVLLAGTNDMLNSRKLATFKDFENNLRFLVQKLKESGSAVVMNTLPPCSEALLLARHKPEQFGGISPSGRVDRANAIIRRVAADFQCELVDLHKIIADSGAPDSAESLLRNPANVQSRDGVHLRKEGYRLWAEQLAQTAALRKLRPGQTVVCLGDSITYGAHLPGAGTTAGDNMPSYLREELNR